MIGKNSPPPRCVIISLTIFYQNCVPGGGYLLIVDYSFDTNRFCLEMKGFWIWVLMEF